MAHRRLQRWLIVLAGSILMANAVGVPARAAAPDGPAADASVPAPTRPSTLVNDPRLDATADDNIQNTVSIAVAGPNIVAAYNDSGSSAGARDPHFVGYSTSADGGVTWTDRGSVYDGPLPVYGSPALAVDDDSSRVFLAVEGASSNSEKSILVFRSDDHGLSFTAPVNATGIPDHPSDAVLPNLAVDNFPGRGRGTVYLAWQQGGPSGGIRLTTSLDSGNSWKPSKPLSLDLQADFGRADLVVSPDHCLHVVYRSTPQGAHPLNTIRTRTSCDRGQSFGPEVVLAALRQPTSADQGLNGQFIAQAEPQIALNPVTGALYVVYHDTTAVLGADALLVASADNGGTWGAPIRIGKDQGRHDQFSPSVAVTHDGTQLMVGFYDRRTDLFDLNVERWGQIGLIDTEADGGGEAVLWRRDFPLSPSFRPPDCCDVDEPPVFFSDYDEIAADDSAFYSAWTDNRDADSFSLFQPDIRAATIPIDATTDVGVTLTGSTSPLPLVAHYFYLSIIQLS
ncbi:MAG: exo-alpha-sialidase [Geodermatophilaceae bacterium]|nr:exo-alpha-sialidase [Geodermatophilaceae bacterium]